MYVGLLQIYELTDNKETRRVTCSRNESLTTLAQSLSSVVRGRVRVREPINSPPLHPLRRTKLTDCKGGYSTSYGIKSTRYPCSIKITSKGKEILIKNEGLLGVRN